VRTELSGIGNILRKDNSIDTGERCTYLFPTMIEYLQMEAGRLVVCASADQADIIRLIAPEESELRQVADQTSAPIDLLSAACDKDERPRIETEDEFRLIVLRIPHEERDSDLPVITVALGIVTTPRFIISVCSVKSMIWETLLRSPRGTVVLPSMRIPFLCMVFMTIANLYLRELQKLRNEADSVERQIHHSLRNEMLIQMLNLEKCLVFFTTSLRGHEPLWERFKRIHGRVLTEDEAELIDDVRIEFRQAQDLAEIHSNILSGMMDAFASVISNNLNVVMKFLTSVTIILALPTLVASVYGMNVELPFQHSPHAFLITMVIAFGLSISTVVLFLKKKYF